MTQPQPGQSSHGLRPDPRFVISDALKQVERDVKTQQTANPLQATTIEQGSLEVIDPRTGTVTFFVGEHVGPGAEETVGMDLTRTDGSLAFQFVGGFVALWDASGNLVLSDDIISKQGLARPYLSAGTWTDQAVTAFTTSSSWVTMQTVELRKTHPKIEGQFLLRSTDSTTTGDLRIQKSSDGSQVGDIQEIDANANVYIPFGPYDLPGGNLERMTLNLQVRRTGGNGQVGVRGISIRGVESTPQV